MMNTYRHIPGEPILKHHPRQSSHDPYRGTPPLIELIPELLEEPWYQQRWKVLVSVMCCIGMVAMGLYGLVQALRTYL